MAITDPILIKPATKEDIAAFGKAFDDQVGIKENPIVGVPYTDEEIALRALRELCNHSSYDEVRLEAAKALLANC